MEEDSMILQPYEGEFPAVCEDPCLPPVSSLAPMLLVELGMKCVCGNAQTVSFLFLSLSLFLAM